MRQLKDGATNKTNGIFYCHGLPSGHVRYATVTPQFKSFTISFNKPEQTKLTLLRFPTGIYAMIDLYGQCVQISIYDADYTESQETIPVPVEQRETEASPIITEGPASMSTLNFHWCILTEHGKKLKQQSQWPIGTKENVIRSQSSN